jgi:hypothetical protein
MGATSKRFDDPDEAKTFERGKIRTVKIGGSTIKRASFEPGWRWSESIGSMTNMDSCPVHHVGYILSGTLHVKTDDGQEAEFGAGEAYEIQPGHDGWVVGDQTMESVEFLRDE